MLTEEEKEKVRKIMEDLEAYINTANLRFLSQAAYNAELMYYGKIKDSILE